MFVYVHGGVALAIVRVSACAVACPRQRPAGSVGLVIERERARSEMDSLRWYQKDSSELLYHEWFYCADLGTELPFVFRRFFASENFKTGAAGKRGGGHVAHARTGRGSPPRRWHCVAPVCLSAGRACGPRECHGVLRADGGGGDATAPLVAGVPPEPLGPCLYPDRAEPLPYAPLHLARVAEARRAEALADPPRLFGGEADEFEVTLLVQVCVRGRGAHAGCVHLRAGGPPM
jgi:hypothetical protein